jgi:hypothetical protein
MPQLVVVAIFQKRLEFRCVFIAYACSLLDAI